MILNLVPKISPCYGFCDEQEIVIAGELTFFTRLQILMVTMKMLARPLTWRIEALDIFLMGGWGWVKGCSLRRVKRMASSRVLL